MTHTSQSWHTSVYGQVVSSLFSALIGMETWPACLREASLGAVWGRQADRVAAPVGVAMHGSAPGLSPGSRWALWAGLGQPGSTKHLLQGSPGVLRELVQLRIGSVSLSKHIAHALGLRAPYTCLQPLQISLPSASLSVPQTSCNRHSHDTAQSAAQQPSHNIPRKSLQVTEAAGMLLVRRGGRGSQHAAARTSESVIDPCWTDEQSA